MQRVLLLSEAAITSDCFPAYQTIPASL